MQIFLICFLCYLRLCGGVFEFPHTTIRLGAFQEMQAISQGATSEKTTSQEVRFHLDKLGMHDVSDVVIENAVSILSAMRDLATYATGAAYSPVSF